LRPDRPNDEDAALSTSSPSPSFPSHPTPDTLAQSLACGTEVETITPKMTLAERDAQALEAFESRFGGSETTMLGTLVDGKPEGLARSVKKNMFRVIGGG
jgi:hypothetical protein